ncbi:unnamed protein product [[Candida] boidinii]|uniref:Unnamed protein product n=1 Tax=Candida boidinii TaxID=5477 RepID=A0ACB5TJN5_CANBO|nr:unnamed protein product [[Candida] boidinii]GME99710.1 unnamed protein product [[Candida] boidinii]
MDRVFKRIGEGLDIFNTLYERHQASTNSSQKDKLESDLKKEIKKLQRFREQVKTWQATNEVKDKDKLNENRRLVEHAMELYKLVEKGSKTKAYSDESLMNVSQEINPEDKEKYEAMEFVRNSLDEIQRQEEVLEVEIDKFTATSKKSKRGNSYANEEKKNELDHFMEMHKWHQEKLEIVLRLLENDILSPEEVLNIQDDVKYFLEENQDADFMNDDTIYDDLNLDQDALVQEVHATLAGNTSMTEEIESSRQNSRSDKQSQDNTSSSTTNQQQQQKTEETTTTTSITAASFCTKSVQFNCKFK